MPKTASDGKMQTVAERPFLQKNLCSVSYGNFSASVLK